MNKLNVLLVAIVMVFATGFANAQKLASVDVNSIFTSMPEMKALDTQLQTLQTAKQAELEKQGKSLQDLMAKYQKEAPTQTQAINEQRSQEVQKLQDNLQQLYAAAQKDIAEKRDAGLAPIEKKINDAITKVAKNAGYEYVFDAASPALLYKAGIDATPAVKKELGL
ncbi:OmpH family outer membrane protein [Chryseobacterium sp. SC28]|uniref:OmpH family outer membrane protein n=1 Tax=Chryseobacterium sp. SC28 TaxID=2268028 RepID=UPI000F650715|nr:OmpH family outer membrane protein [Chryseobacterium sp. SC28]RRQ45052.1 OmpH family outer membrane protein [Chryseobacterium sp. SC28]